MPTPSISVVPQPALGSVMITVNFAAFPTAKYARVLRVAADGTTTAVRTNTSSDTSGDYIELSAGIAVLYDAEAPRDVTSYYTTDAIDSGFSVVMMPVTVFYDGFEANLATNWPTGTRNNFTQSATHVLTGSFAGLATSTSAGLVTREHSQNAVNVGDNLLWSAWLFQTSSLTTPGLELTWYDSSGVFISTTTPTPITIPTNTWTNVVVTAATPATTAFVGVGFTWTAAGAGETLWVDEAMLTNLTKLTTATATSIEVILGSSGNLFLADPFYPAHNLRISLSPSSPSLPECVPGEGIFFIGMGDRNYGTQTTNWSVANSSVPIPLTQVRSKPVSTLQLVLRTFADGDALNRLTGTGNVLWMFVPAKYGYGYPYVSVGDVTLGRMSRDYRRQWQLAGLPWVTVAQPAGLSYGTLGTRWDDLCQPYATFAAATAANVTWMQVLTGYASLVGPPASFRTWAAVLTSFASWSAVNSGGRTWQQLLAGS